MRRSLRILLALAGLASSSVALAYILPGWSLLRKVEARREELGLRSLQASGTLSLTGAPAEALGKKLGLPLDQGLLTVRAVASYRMPGRCRIEVALPGAKDKLFAQSKRQAVSGSEELKPAQAMLGLACPVLSARGGDEDTHTITEWLKTLGVDFQTLSLARGFSGTLAEVVGADSRQLDQPQIWIDKNDFIPERLIARQGTLFYDLRLIDTGSIGGDWHPRVVELWQSGKGVQVPELLARFSVDKVEPNANVSDF